MAAKEFLDDREHALENEYFFRKDRELIDHLREEGRKEAERRALEEELQTHDTAFLQELQAAGFSPDNLRLIHLVPLVEVAWSEGEVTARERELILALASRRGFATDSAAFQQLVGWLDSRPDAAFFETTYEAIRRLLALQDETSRQATREDLVAWCTRIAEATGGILGMAPISKDERECLRRVAERISTPPDAE
jgi:hypothetical protein